MFDHKTVLMLGLIAALPIQAGTLAEALERAWSLHPQAASMAAWRDESRARADEAAGLTPGPAALSLSGLSDRFNDNRGKREWELELAAPLWLPGQQLARAAEAASAQDAVAARRDALRLRIAGELRALWWTLAGARNAVELGERRVSAARALEAEALRRHEAGTLARIDANLARDERLDAEARLLEAETTLRDAELAYRNATGIDAPAVLAPEHETASAEDDEAHPELLAATAAGQLARAKLKVVEKSGRDAPELAVQLVRDRGESGESYADSLRVKLTIPFSSGPRARRENAAALAEATQAEAELALARLRIGLDAERARLDLASARQSLDMARGRAELTADNLRLAEEGFTLGESDLPSLLRARAKAFEAESLLKDRQVAREAALSRLNQALGVLP